MPTIDPTDPHDISPGMPGQRLARGVARLLHSMNHAAVTEFVPRRGLRVDLISIGPRSEVWIIECKSSRADFTSDRKQVAFCFTSFS